MPEAHENKKNYVFIGGGKMIETMKICSEEVILGKYKASDIVKSIETFSQNFNKTNKRTNLASGIISILSAASLFISGIII